MAEGNSRVKRPIDVTLCGSYGFGNLGDELIAEGIMLLLEKNGITRERSAVLTSSGAVPDGSIPVDRWNPGRVFRALRESRTLLLGGGGLFQDSTSMRSCLYYWGVTRMAIAAGCVPWAFGQSVGPLKSRLASFLARDALRLCSARGVRDRGSMEILSRWGLDGEKTPDPVVALSGFFKGSGSGGRYMLVNIRPWHGDLPEATALAVSEAAGKMGLPVLGVALSEEDADEMERLRKKGAFDPEDITIVRDTDRAKEVWGLGRCAAGMRLHFCVLSLLAGIPCSAVPYDPKVSWFAREWGMPLWVGEGALPLAGMDHGSSGERLQKAERELDVSFAKLLGTALAGR